jgi:hypothetical protein
MDDAAKAYWRNQLTPILHPHLPQMGTLIETANKLNAARGFIEPLSPSVDDEREQGLFVASLAIRCGLNTLEHFGLIDGDDPPMPINLAQAKQALTNVLAVINETIRHGQLAVSGADDAGDDISIEDEGTGAAARPVASVDDKTPKRPKRRDTPDNYEADLLVKRFLDGNPNATVKQVSEATGISTGRIAGLESWKRLMAQRKADRPTPKKSERPLTNKMLATRGKTDDPAEKIMKDEAVWQWLLENAEPKQKAELYLKTPELRQQLIELAREQYADDMTDADD